MRSPRFFLLLLALMWSTSSIGASDSLQWPESPDFTFTEEDYEETTVQVGQLRIALWYEKMYLDARVAHAERDKLDADRELFFKRVVSSKDYSILTLTWIAGCSIGAVLLLTIAAILF